MEYARFPSLFPFSTSLPTFLPVYDNFNIRNMLRIPIHVQVQNSVGEFFSYVSSHCWGDTSRVEDITSELAQLTASCYLRKQYLTNTSNTPAVRMCQGYAGCTRVSRVRRPYACQGYAGRTRVSRVRRPYACLKGTSAVCVSPAYVGCMRFSRVRRLYACVKGTPAVCISQGYAGCTRVSRVRRLYACLQRTSAVCVSPAYAGCTRVSRVCRLYACLKCLESAHCCVIKAIDTHG